MLARCRAQCPLASQALHAYTRWVMGTLFMGAVLCRVGLWEDCTPNLHHQLTFSMGLPRSVVLSTRAAMDKALGLGWAQ